jgi:hypothetical protein
VQIHLLAVGPRVGEQGAALHDHRFEHRPPLRTERRVEQATDLPMARLFDLAEEQLVGRHLLHAVQPGVHAQVGAVGLHVA